MGAPSRLGFPIATATVSRFHWEECGDSRESQGDGQGEDRENLADRPAQPTGNTTPGNTQPPRIPRDSAMVSRLRREEREMGREPRRGRVKTERTLPTVQHNPLATRP
eukprot:3236036-Pyramimonas_sp.AAC.1